MSILNQVSASTIDNTPDRKFYISSDVTWLLFKFFFPSVLQFIELLYSERVRFYVLYSATLRDLLSDRGNSQMWITDDEILSRLSNYISPKEA